MINLPPARLRALTTGGAAPCTYYFGMRDPGPLFDALLDFADERLAGVINIEKWGNATNLYLAGVLVLPITMPEIPRTGFKRFLADDEFMVSVKEKGQRIDPRSVHRDRLVSLRCEPFMLNGPSMPCTYPKGRYYVQLGFRGFSYADTPAESFLGDY